MTEWLSLCFPSPGGPGRGLCAQLTPVPQGLNFNPYLLNGRREKKYHPLPHTYPQLKLQTQTASNISSDPTFQRGLSPASFKPLPGVACLHLNSLHISWICSPLHCGLLTSGTCFLGHQYLPIPNQPTTLICIEQTCPFSGLHPVSSSLSLLFTVCLLCLPPLSAFSLNIKASKSFSSWSLNMPHSLWAMLSIFTDSTTTFSVTNTQVLSQVSLKYQTLTSNDL